MADQQLAPDQDPVSAALAYAIAVRNAYELRLKTMGHVATPPAGWTSHVSVVDADGTVVSLINTLLFRFGSFVVLPQAGFLMNDEMMWFDPRPGQSNSIAPGDKPLADMRPLVLCWNWHPYLAHGAAGGRTIFPALLQIMSHVVDGSLSFEEAFHAPWIEASPPTIRVNRRAAPEVRELLATRFPIEFAEDTVCPTNFAIPSAVMRTLDGENVGVAHPTYPWGAAFTAEACESEIRQCPGTRR